MDERIYWLGFSIFPGIGPAKFSLLIKYFGSAKTAWEASPDELKKSKVGNAIAEKFVHFREHTNLKEHEKRAKKENVRILILTDKEYPETLAKIPKAPFVLYVKGEMQNLTDKKLIAVVGTRKITEYGQHVTKMLTEELVSAGWTIVSGLALGVDAVAHATALSSGGGTIAVLGCGVDCCTPRENELLYRAILENKGTIISELPIGMLPSVGSFPSRNRIIAGLSRGVLVTEGASDSGSLITANDALTYGRKVFAVPGPITSALSKGPHELYAKGGKLVTSGEEILKEMDDNPASPRRLRGASKSIRGDTKEEQKIIDLLQDQTLHFDDIVRRSGLDSAATGTILSFMEMKGLIKRLSSNMYSINI